MDKKQVHCPHLSSPSGLLCHSLADLPLPGGREVHKPPPGRVLQWWGRGGGVCTQVNKHSPCSHSIHVMVTDINTPYIVASKTRRWFRSGTARSCSVVRHENEAEVYVYDNSLMAAEKLMAFSERTTYLISVCNQEGASSWLHQLDALLAYLSHQFALSGIAPHVLLLGQSSGSQHQSPAGSPPGSLSPPLPHRPRQEYLGPHPHSLSYVLVLPQSLPRSPAIRQVENIPSQ